MLSFVVQNFYYDRCFLTKTDKLRHLIKRFSNSIIFLFFKSNLHFLLHLGDFRKLDPYVIHFTRRNLIRPFWRITRRLANPYMGLVSNNYSKSLSFHTLTALDTSLFKRRVVTHNNHLLSTGALVSLTYSTPLPTVSFALQKTMCGTLMIYIIYFLIGMNTSTRGSFKLHHGFIFLPNVIRLYLFCNKFYFKIKNH